MKASTAVSPLGWRWALGISAAVLLAYISIRAHTVSFGFDEAFTYMYHVRKGKLVLLEHDLSTANHHALNVWGMWLFMKLFGPNDFAMRVPNLIGGLVYFYAAMRLSLLSRSKVLALASFVILCAQPYLLDFFSLARGYGISNGLLLLSLWLLHRFATEGRQQRFALRSVAAAALAVLAHTVLLNYLLALLAVVAVLLLLDAKRNGSLLVSKELLGTIGGVAAVLGFVIWNAIGMRAGGALFHGSEDLWEGTLGSLARMMAYRLDLPWEPLPIMGAFLILLVVACVAAVVIARRTSAVQPVWLGLAVIGIMLLAFQVQHALLGLNWPAVRTGLFIVPLLGWLLVSAVQAWSIAQRVPVFVAAVLAVALLVHFARSANLEVASEWRECGPVRELTRAAIADHQPRSARRPVITISTNVPCGSSLIYYLRTAGTPWMVNVHQPDYRTVPHCDYHLGAIDQAAATELGWTLVGHSAAAGTALYRDEAMHRPFEETVFEATIPAFEADDTTRHGLPKPSVSWTVPEGMGNERVLVAGSVRAVEQSDASWLTLVIDQYREGERIGRIDVASHGQVPSYGEWYDAGIVYMPKDLKPGDELRFDVIPYLLAPRIHLGDMRLVVSR